MAASDLTQEAGGPFVGFRGLGLGFLGLVRKKMDRDYGGYIRVM